jgi:hypothetical protein
MTTKKLARAVKAPATQPDLTEAFRTKMLGMLAGPLTPATVRRIQQMAGLCHEALVIETNPEALPKRRRGGYSVANLSSTGNYMDSDDGNMVISSGYNGMSSETFGATILREMVPLLTNVLAPKPVEFRESTLTLVEAIDRAKKAGLKDIAAGLQKQLEARIAEPTPKLAPMRPALPPAKKKIGSFTPQVQS